MDCAAMAESNIFLEAAISYARRGWPVLPLHSIRDDGSCSCGKADCSSPGKHPRTKHGVRDATTDQASIARWWARWPEANVGLATGEKSGTVLDVDGPEGEESIQGKVLPRTPQQRTAKGRHIWFAHCKGLKNRVRLAPGLDVRNDGGYVVAAPSVHEWGVIYEWIETPYEVDLGAAPKWFLDMAMSNKDEAKRPSLPTTPIADRYLQAAIEKEVAIVSQTAQGDRNNKLNDAAVNLGQLVAGGALSESVVIEHLVAAALEAGLTEHEARKTIASGMRFGRQRPRRPPEQRAMRVARDVVQRTHEQREQANQGPGKQAERKQARPEPQKLSEAIDAIPSNLQGAELSKALRPVLEGLLDAPALEYEERVEQISARFGLKRSAVIATVREVRAQRPSTEKVYRSQRPHELARDMLSEHQIRFASEKYWVWMDGGWRDGKSAVQAIVADACESSYARGAEGELKPYPTTTTAMNNVLKHVEIRSAVRCTPPCWLPEHDGDWPVEDCLVCPDCVVNVRTLERAERTPRLFATSELGCAPDDGEPIEWLSFLDSSGVNVGDQVLLQEWMGLCLVPDTRYQRLCSIVGAPRSGKGTILRVMRAILRDSMLATTPRVLGSRFGLEDLPGKLVLELPDASWTGDDLQFAVERIKSITGEDAVSIEPKGGRIFSQRLTCRITLASNTEPKLPDPSGAIASRILTVKVPVSHLGREDLGLEARLIGELPQIMHWCVLGLQRLRERGSFSESESSIEAKTRAREASSPQLAWVAECCEVGAQYQESRENLWGSWSKWADKNGHRRGSANSLYSSILDTLCLTHKKVQGVRYLGGIRLIPFEPF